MKIVKKLTSILLSIIIIISLCACEKNVITEETTKQSEEKALVSIDIKELGDICILGADSNKKYTAILYSNYIGEIGEDTPEDEIPPMIYHISLIDTEKNEILKTIEFDNPDYNSYKVVLSNDISLFNEQKGEMISYDYDLESKEIGSYRYEEYWETGKRAGLDYERFNCQDGFATSTSFDFAQALMFYENPDTFYMIKNNNYYEFRDKVNHNLLIVDNEANKTDKPESILRIFDFDNQKEINSIKIPNSHSYNNIALTSYNEDRVTAVTTDEYYRVDKIYVWNYMLNPTNKAFENGYCDIITADQIKTKIKDVETRVKENCGITLECNADKDFLQDEHKYQNNYDDIFVYQKALDLEQLLSILPKDIYNEILCNDLENPVSKFDELRLYLVGAFDESIDAYASNIACDETNDKHIVYIAYSCTGLNQKTFFHEFMHTFEYRIWNYEKDFDSKWEKLNPKGFDYTDDYAEIYYDEKHNDWRNYFLRDYGMKSILEDRATCFEDLCDGCLNDDIWWKDKPNIVAKEKYLTKVIEKSFPSLANNNIWKTQLTNI